MRIFPWRGLAVKRPMHRFLCFQPKGQFNSRPTDVGQSPVEPFEGQATLSSIFLSSSEALLRQAINAKQSSLQDYRLIGTTGVPSLDHLTATPLGLGWDRLVALFGSLYGPKTVAANRMLQSNAAGAANTVTAAASLIDMKLTLNSRPSYVTCTFKGEVL